MRRSPFLTARCGRFTPDGSEGIPQASKQSQEYFRAAVAGGRVMLAAGESVVWGWGGLANRVSKVAFGERSDRSENHAKDVF